MSKSLVICSSANFYEHAIAIADELEAAGCEVVVPKSAAAMKERGDYTVRKTWYDDPDAYVLKADFMRTHFDKITDGDAILVVNDEKYGVHGYIGPNVLLEMSLAWYQNKPVYLLNQFPDDSPFEEEIKGMMPIILDGDLKRLKEELS